MTILRRLPLALLPLVACDQATAPAPETFREAEMTIVVDDGRADTLLAALESADNEGARVRVSGQYTVDRGITLARDLEVIGVSDEEGIPPTIHVASLDGQGPDDCRGLVCMTGGNKVKNFSLTMGVDPERTGVEGTFPVVRVDDSADGKAKVVDVWNSGGIGAGVEVTAARDGSQTDYEQKGGAILIVISQLSIISIVGVSFVYYSDNAEMHSKLEDTSITGVDTGIGLISRGVSGGDAKVKWNNVTIAARDNAVEGQMYQTELLSMRLVGQESDISYGGYGVMLDPNAGGISRNNEVKVELAGPVLAGGTLVAVPPPAREVVPEHNTLDIRVSAPENEDPLDFAVPYIRGTRTTIKIGDDE